MMSGTGSGFGQMILGGIVDIIVITIVVGIALLVLSKTGALGGDRERIIIIEKDLHDIKEMVERINNKLEEI